ncbi:ice-binding family protein [Sinisalibacter lacisalsi]|uniref:Autotransporter domain-containing protein n=1 Tax=Sinisalibacter lacisalsi TaxID=1526570 RepID=A0ABQ1QX26_9RHOB|nr:ice-binding family protein [Sinisalibacter lacisalsi]GGD47753.1 hypothetical protein GCM10011358_34440 [Sinisalibacter lacisalsi]
MSKSLRVVAASALAAIPFSIAQVSESTAQELYDFGVIAGQSLTNTGPTTIVGDIAVSPGSSYTGSGSVTHTGATYLGDAVAARIQDDLTTLYMVLSGRTTSVGGDLTGQDLGGMVLSPGVYNFDTSAMISAGQTLTLDGGGDPNAIFIFNIGSTLTAQSGSAVVLQNGAQGGNVFYRIGSSATLDTTADLVGQLVALTSISLNTSATLGCGAAYARNGSVTLDSNTIGICTLAGNDFDTVVDESELTENELAIAEALSDYVAGGGVLPIGFAILAATQTAEELALSLAQLSGEVVTGVAPTGMQAMNAFLDTAVGSGSRPRNQVMAPSEPGIPAGMVREKIDAVYGGKLGAAQPGPVAPALAYPASLAAQPRPWDVWASAYGSRAVTDGDPNRGLQERTSQNLGFAAGLNHAVGSSSDIGIALSWNQANFALGNGFGSGTSDTLFVALRGQTSTDLGYLEAALAYGRSDITTDRTLTIAGVDRLIGATTADTFAAHVEAGYHMGNFTPFAGLRAQSYTTHAFSETAASGTSSYALQYDEHTTTSLRSELGLDMQWVNERDGGAMTTFGLRAAWAHEFASNQPGTRSFVNAPGVTFPASGAARDRDSLILAANAGMAASNGLYFDGAIKAEYSRSSRDLGGSLTVGYRW